MARRWEEKDTLRGWDAGYAKNAKRMAKMAGILMVISCKSLIDSELRKEEAV
jgi:hypothetical protein